MPSALPPRPARRLYWNRECAAPSGRLLDLEDLDVVVGLVERGLGDLRRVHAAGEELVATLRQALRQHELPVALAMGAHPHRLAEAVGVRWDGPEVRVVVGQPGAV